MALEMAMDELAEALSMDPVELRLRNDAEHDEEKNAAVVQQGAAGVLSHRGRTLRLVKRPGAAGLDARRPHADRLWHGDGVLSGRSQRRPSAQAILYANGTVVVRTAASDMGPGTYTAMTQLAAETLDLPIERVHFELGDTDMPEAPVHGGSITLVSVGNAVVEACQALREKLPRWARRGRAMARLLRTARAAKPGSGRQGGTWPGDGEIFLRRLRRGVRRGARR